MTLFYEGQFWVGVVEQVEGDKLWAGRHVFGAEPNDMEVLEFVNRRLLRMMQNLGQHAQTKVVRESRVNPKRMARLVARDIQQNGVSTYAQEAIKAEHEHRKQLRKTVSREAREALKERKRELARQKAKAKHRGR